MSIFYKIIIIFFASPILIYSKDRILYYIVPKFPYQILYPSPDNRNLPSLNIDEPERAGSEFSINFYMQYKNINLQEILIHTEKSCRKFSRKIVKSSQRDENEGDGLDGDWYKPSVFHSERIQYFNSRKDIFSCFYYEPSGDYIAISKRFVSKYRIMIVMHSEENCNKMESNFKSLSNLVKFRKRKDKIY